MKVVITTVDNLHYFGHVVSIDGEEIASFSDDTMGKADEDLAAVITAVFAKASCGGPLELIRVETK